MAFELPALPYDFNELEPTIDTQTMQIHYGKHHQGYTDKLNAAVEKGGLSGKSIEELLASLDSLPEEVKSGVRNNGGGYANHALFWQIMAPKGKGGSPSEKLNSAIESAFGGLDKLKEEFNSAAAGRFGSGWAWLVKDDSGKLSIGSTPNQDTPLMGKAIAGLDGTPILGLDVWEHAYYLKYQNKRPEYVSAWWDVVNWEKVSELFEK